MPAKKDLTMLKPNSLNISIAMANKEYTPLDLARVAELPVNIVYSIRRGCYTKPKYIGRIAKALEVDVAQIIEPQKTA